MAVVGENAHPMNEQFEREERERERRAQRNSRRRELYALRRRADAPVERPPTAKSVRTEYRAEMRLLRRPLREINAANAGQMETMLRALRQQNLETPPPPTSVVGIRRFFRDDLERLECAQRYIAKDTKGAWAQLLMRLRSPHASNRSFVARAMVRCIFERLRYNAQRQRAIHAFMQRRRDASARNVLHRLHSLRNVRFAYPIDELANRYQEMVNQLTAEARLEPHRIVLTSARLNTRTIERAVTNTWHGANWVTQITGNGGEVDSEGHAWNEYANGEGDAFDEVYIDIQPITGGCYKDLNTSQKRTRLTNEYKLETFCPTARLNNCAFECLRHIATKHGIVIKPSNSALRKTHNIEPNTEVSCQMLLALCKEFMPKRKVVIVLDDFNDTMDMTSADYIVLHNHHYQVVESVERRTDGATSKRITRGVLAMDFETRPSLTDPTVMIRRVKDPITKVVTKTKVNSHRLVDTICHARFIQNGDRTDLASSMGLRHIDFTTNRTASSARQFLDWLKDEAQTHQRHYQVVAYNGSRFDYYLLFGAMTEEETYMLEQSLQLRGKAIIGFEIYGCLFKDPNLFLMGSLDHNCKEFKLDCTKQLEFTLSNGTVLDNKQLCFYRPELDVWDFLELERTEPDFWHLYMTYCDLDCGALYELWKRFRKEVDELTFKMGGVKLLAKCRLVGSCTIGSHAKKLLMGLNRDSLHFRSYESFFYGHKPEPNWSAEDYANSVRERYDFVSKCKRGGISHVNQPGRHDESVVGVDIVSQYAAALMNMVIPAGRSKMVTSYDAKMYGFYEVRRLRFAEDDLRFRCIAYAPPKTTVKSCAKTDGKDKTLNWKYPWNNSQTEHESVYLDSQMLAYLTEECGLESFEVVKGYVSKQCIKGKCLFGKYVSPLFREKVRQDELQKYSPLECNMAMREACKLLLNALTGKLVEDCARYYKLAFTSIEEEASGVYSKSNSKQVLLNGVKVIKVYDNGQNQASSVSNVRSRRIADVNVWVAAGVCVYSYSKILLFKYINLLPKQAEDVIHVETDGIYFPARCLETFRENLARLPPNPAFPLAIGSELGNVKIESVSIGSSYWLGKKFYYYRCEKKNEMVDVMRLRGIVQKTIAEDGTTIQVVEPSVYERVYNGESFPLEFATLKKVFYGGKVHIQAHRTQRRVRPMCMPYKLYA